MDNSSPSKKILVAPLDWGLGHATRMIPVIRELLQQGCEVIVAGEGSTQRLLKEEFPSLKFIFLKGYRLRYSAHLPAWLKILLQMPRIFLRAWAEHSELKKVCTAHNIDVVISDNRFGLWNDDCRSIYITHQVMIRCPRAFRFMEPVLSRLHKMVMRKFDRCWIPDYEGSQNLSGDLGHRYPPPSNTLYIGPLSRFVLKPPPPAIEYDVCILLSGPEPARTEFEMLVRRELKSYAGKAVFILGKPGENNPAQIRENVKTIGHLPAEEMQQVLVSSGKIICRPGYSSVMDMVALGKEALFVPTPGQTEQEYLAGYLQGRKFFRFVAQKKFNLQAALNDDKEFGTGNIFIKDPATLRKAVNELKDL